MKEGNSDASSKLKMVKSYLSYLERMGEEFVPRLKAKTPASAPLRGGRDPLTSLRDEVLMCINCDALVKTRKTIVFGSGNPHASLLFVGEAPGAEEDLQGLPFVGAAGQLLTKIIEAMGLKREDVFICNVLKCRPPGNRNPLPDEILNCKPYLFKQIEAIKPRIICALGTFSAQLLLNTEATISALRGKFHDYQGFKIMPTFHPSYLLRNPGEKKKVWDDMQMIMKELNRT